MNRTIAAFVFVSGAFGASAAFAGFDSQPVLGPLFNGSVVTGTTVGQADNNDGFFSGDHIFNIWNGPDIAYQLNWTGGDMQITLSYNAAISDLDVFLYKPGSLDDSGDYGITNLSPDTIFLPNADAGIYYIVIDSADAGSAGAYELAVTPAPGSFGMLAIGGLIVMRRKR
jgi:hypothetical protein